MSLLTLPSVYPDIQLSQGVCFQILNLLLEKVRTPRSPKPYNLIPPGRYGAHLADIFLFTGSVPAVFKICKPIRVDCRDAEINLLWVSACGCVYPSYSRESRLKIAGTFIQEGMKGPVSLLHVPGVEPRSEDSKNGHIPLYHLFWNTVCSRPCDGINKSESKREEIFGAWSLS
jgi:hypothetical protein